MQYQGSNEKQTGIKRRPWTGEEDKALLCLREVKRLKRWTDISEQMEVTYNIQGRSEKQCRDRYYFCLTKILELSQGQNHWR